ncbi:hypothetical protein KSP40_PGU016036 [Platanthera guangdongensis]|uniref:Hyaluronan/mRNA-binding protein domain-containing protein n=1 Tax=Platanthera guangdongensis TaxID=2320717 RepID=A0ABR2M0C9_9ASPA
MATANPFDLLGDNENDDLSQLLAAQQKKVAVDKPAAPPAAKLPSKPLPPAQAVRESRSHTADGRGAAVRGAPGRGTGGRGAGIGQSRDFGNGNSSRYGGGGGGGGYRSGSAPEEGDTSKPLEVERGSYGQPRGPFRGVRRGGYADGNADGGADSERPQRRVYERRSGTGRGYEMKREGAGRGNWGTVADDVNAQEIDELAKSDEKPVAPEKQVELEDGQRADASKDKDGATNEAEVKEPEDNVCSIMPFFFLSIYILFAR